MWCYIGILAIDSPIYTLYYFLHNTLGISTLPLWIWKLNQLGRALCSLSVHFSDLDYSCVITQEKYTNSLYIHWEFSFLFSGDDYILLFFNHLSFLYYYYYLLYNIVLVLPYINMNLPQVYIVLPFNTLRSSFLFLQLPFSLSSPYFCSPPHPDHRISISCQGQPWLPSC